MIDTEDKLAWCLEGELLEHEFIRVHGERLGLSLNPGKEFDKETGKYLPDLFSYRYSVVSDLKRVTTPFFTAKSYGYLPDTTVTLNIKDVFRYSSKYPQMLIYFWVTWPEQEQYGHAVKAVDGVWVASIKKIFSFQPVIHGYQKREQDTKGNAKCSLLIDLNKMTMV